ncbi:MAG: hypothetical protein ACRC3B_03815, partial [Bacteroidia bacterium]
MDRCDDIIIAIDPGFYKWVKDFNDDSKIILQKCFVIGVHKKDEFSLLTYFTSKSVIGVFTLDY